ncbi:DNA-binding transcriptional regulator, XRE family [Selenomonas ruminantium]|uniref:DNA-binding transcriptional regulator, XRE family n=1 Tax=Selenomonas ruminantium TaxID=971 RepID=A0A1I3ES43_SELRU|nr:helix-turn-helix transcriptional regulator [Selenomonas ruminantium]SFI01461.1 DNA-binding transcriptional regulator, XRE family [Selenomonas ruminantium]
MNHLCYKKLMKLLVDREIKQKELCQLADISTSTMAKLKRKENVNTEVLVKICAALHCDIADICEIETEDMKDV